MNTTVGQIQKKTSSGSQGTHSSGVWLVYSFFNISSEMQIIKHQKIYHLSILLIRYWLLSRPGTLVTSFNYTAV